MIRVSLEKIIVFRRTDRMPQLYVVCKELTLGFISNAGRSFVTDSYKRGSQTDFCDTSEETDMRSGVIVPTPIEIIVAYVLRELFMQNAVNSVLQG